MAESAVKFWMVYGLDFGPPTVSHPTQADADREAKRLAKANPDHWFVVLEATTATIKRTTHTITLRDPASVSKLSLTDDDIPF